jgi:ribonuclease-3
MGIYSQAFSHKSVAKKNTQGLKLSNERLEFLGDSVISTIVSEYLFEKFPNEDEGYLTQMRSKIVSRKSLNSLGEKIGLEPFVKYLKGNFPYKSLLGNVFEALIGAIYLDKGYKKAKEVFIEHVLEQYIDLENLEAINIDHKSQLLIYCQKNRLELEFKILKEETVKGSIKFTSCCRNCFSRNYLDVFKNPTSFLSSILHFPRVTFPFLSPANSILSSFTTS